VSTTANICGFQLGSRCAQVWLYLRFEYLCILFESRKKYLNGQKVRNKTLKKFKEEERKMKTKNRTGVDPTKLFFLHFFSSALS